MRLPFAPLPEKFIPDTGAARIVLVDYECVSDGLRVRFLPVTNHELDRTVAPLGADAIEPAPAPRVARLFDAELEAVGQEPEGVEQGALADAVPADDGRHRSQRRNLW